MYAPLTSPLPPHFLSPDTLRSCVKVVELKKPRKEKKRFVEQVGEHLKSGDYMYAPFVVSPNPFQEPFKLYGMIKKAVSTRRLTIKVNQPTDHLGNANQRFGSHPLLTHLSDQLTLGQKETTKHTVYQSCRSISTSAKRRIGVDISNILPNLDS